jgi:hypothetical protein
VALQAVVKHARFNKAAMIAGQKRRAHPRQVGLRRNAAGLPRRLRLLAMTQAPVLPSLRAQAKQSSLAEWSRTMHSLLSGCPTWRALGCTRQSLSCKQTRWVCPTHAGAHCARRRAGWPARRAGGISMPPPPNGS